MLGAKSSLSLIAMSLLSFYGQATTVPENAIFQYQSKSDWKTNADSVQCGDWTPTKDSVLIGQSVIQKRICSGIQEQVVVDAYQTRDTGESITNSYVKKRDFSQSQQRTGYGSLDPIVSTSSSAWSAWRPLDIDASTCREPDISDADVPLDKTFLSMSWCQASVERVRHKVERHYSGEKHITDEISDREQDVTAWPVITMKPGKQDAWLAPETMYGAWENQGDGECEDWPENLEQLRAEVMWGEPVLAVRECARTQTRQVSSVKSSLSGKQETLSSSQESREVVYKDEQTFTGTRDDVVSTAMEPIGPWVTVSKDCSPADMKEWLPLGRVASVLQECNVEETQRIGQVTKYLSGKKDISEPTTQSRQLTSTFITLVEGEKDVLIAKNAETRTSDWVDSGAVQCTAWAPSFVNVDRGISFLQMQTCEQPQSRTKESMDKWASGAKWQVVAEEKRSLDSHFVQLAVGVKQPSDTWFEESVVLREGESDAFLSEPVSVPRADRYDRLKVMVDIKGRADLADIAMVNGEKAHVLPTMSRPKQTFYFAVEASEAKTQNWQVRVTPNAGMPEDVTINITATLLDLSE